jgi:hypothetical protein
LSLERRQLPFEKDAQFRDLRVWTLESEKQSAGFVGFIPVQISGKTAASKVASRFQEDLMSRLIRSAQNIFQVLPLTLR